MRTRNLLRLVAVTCAITLTAVACGENGGAEGDGERSIVRFAFSPDPVIDWMNDQGIIPEYEEQYNVRLVTTSTWDEFAFFAGGHGDIVSMATYETPLLEQETGVDTVTFGSYNNLRVPVFVRSDSDYETFEDLQGQNVAVPGPVSSTIVWGMFIKDWYGLDFCIERPDGSDCADYDVRRGRPLREHGVARPRRHRGVRLHPGGRFPVLADRRDPGALRADALPVGALRGHVRGRTQGRQREQLRGPEGLVRQPSERGGVLPRALWERGIQEWSDNKEEIIRTYPQHFAVEDDADVDFAVEFMEEHDFFTDTVYMDEEWVDERDGRLRPDEKDGLDGSRRPRSPSSRSWSRRAGA